MTFVVGLVAHSTANYHPWPQDANGAAQCGERFVSPLSLPALASAAGPFRSVSTIVVETGHQCVSADIRPLANRLNMSTANPSQLHEITARRICLVKPSALGDIVQTMPLLPALRDRFPHAQISWVVSSEFTNLLEGHPCLDRIIPYHRRGPIKSWLRLLHALRHHKFDLVFDLQGLLRSAVMTWATRANLRVGLETAREGAQGALHLTLPDTGRDVPAYARYWRVAEELGVGYLQQKTLISIDKHDREWTAQRLAQIRGPLLAIHPGARWLTKRWPVEKFAVVACKAMRIWDFATVIVGSSAEKQICDHLESLLRRFVPSKLIMNLAGETTLKQLATTLCVSDVLLTNDTGPMHLAAGLGTPVLGLFTCTSPERSGPPGDQHKLVATHVECAASYKKKCPINGKDHLQCMEELETAPVIRALVDLMAKQNVGRGKLYRARAA